MAAITMTREEITDRNYRPTPAERLQSAKDHERLEIERLTRAYTNSGGTVERIPFGKGSCELNAPIKKSKRQTILEQKRRNRIRPGVDTAP